MSCRQLFLYLLHLHGQSQVTSACDIRTAKGKYKPSTATEYVTVLLRATCFGCIEKRQLKIHEGRYLNTNHKNDTCSDRKQ